MREIYVAALVSHFPFIDHGRYAQGHLRDGVLETGPEEKHVRRSKAIVLITAERRPAINVGTTQRRLKIEGHGISRRYERLADEQAQADSAFQVPRLPRRREWHNGRALKIRAA